MLPKPLPRPFSLLLDVDGTLIDIAPTPDSVDVPPALKQALSALNDKLDGAIALVSGRTVADLDRLFAPVRLRASGVHGAELRFHPDGAVETLPEARLPEPVIAGLQALAGQHPGTLVENKVFSAAIHYRAVPASGAAVGEGLQRVVMDSGLSDLRILPGHMVFEVKRSGFDKGVAIGRFLARPPFSGRLPVFLGDDVTDEPGFDLVAARGGLAMAVGTPRRSAPAVFESPEAVRAWLAGLAQDVADLS